MMTKIDIENGDTDDGDGNFDDDENENYQKINKFHSFFVKICPYKLAKKGTNKSGQGSTPLPPRPV